MPPKIKISKEDILCQAIDLVRADGWSAVNARELAKALNCSTQPIFSNFSSMQELREAVMQKAEEICREYLQREAQSGQYPTYKASGMAYIRFAKEDKELFKLLYMCDRTGQPIPEDSQLTDEMEMLVNQNTGLDGMNAKLFHLEMWAYVHGVAVMAATGYLDLEWELISHMLTDAYNGLCKQHGMG